MCGCDEDEIPGEGVGQNREGLQGTCTKKRMIAGSMSIDKFRFSGLNHTNIFTALFRGKIIRKGKNQLQSGSDAFEVSTKGRRMIW